MRFILKLGILLIILFACPSLKAQQYELVCPIGSRAVDTLTTLNTISGLYRQNYCVDVKGNISENISGSMFSSSPTLIFGGTCNIAGMQSATSQAFSAGGGIADFRACNTISTNITNATNSVNIPANVTLLLGASTITCTITTVSTPCFNKTGSNSKLIGMGMGDQVINDSGADPSNSAANGITNLICNGCGTTTDMIREAIPSASRTGYTQSLIVGNETAGLWINMGNSGRHAIYADSVHFSKYHDIAGYNFPGDGLLIENDIASPVNNATSYHDNIYQILMQAPHSNITGASCHFASANGTGDITWNTFVINRCAGNITNGGGKYGLWLQALSSNFHQNNFQASYIGETNDIAGSYGIKLEASGNWASSINPYIADDTFQSILVEKLFAGSQGICMGGSIGASASGTGLGGINLTGVSCSANWATPLDSANLGMHAENAGSTVRLAGAAPYVVKGTSYGNNSAGMLVQQTATALQNNDTLYGHFVLMPINVNSKTGVVVRPIGIDCSNDILISNGTPASHFCLYIASAQTGTLQGGMLIDNFGTGPSIRLNNSGPIDFIGSTSGTTRIQPQAAAGGTLSWPNITGTIPSGIYNANGTIQTIAPHIVQDTATLAAGTVTVTLTGSAVFTNATSYSCVADDDTAIAATRVLQNSGSSITITGTGTDVIRFICVGN